MKINIEKIIIKEFCEELPFNWAPFEEAGYCKRPNEYCKYFDKETEFCKKQTYTSIENRYILI